MAHRAQFDAAREIALRCCQAVSGFVSIAQVGENGKLHFRRAISSRHELTESLGSLQRDGSLVAWANLQAVVLWRLQMEFTAKIAPIKSDLLMVSATPAQGYTVFGWPCHTAHQCALTVLEYCGDYILRRRAMADHWRWPAGPRTGPPVVVPETAGELGDAIIEAYHALPDETLESWLAEMTSIKAMVEREYLAAVGRLQPAILNRDVGETLRELVSVHGRRWNKIAEIMRNEYGQPSKTGDAWRMAFDRLTNGDS